MRDEMWLPVPHYEGFYEASSFHRVRSLDRVVTDSRGQRRHLRGRMLYATSGQGTIMLSRDGHSFQTTITDVCARTFAAVPIPA